MRRTLFMLAPLSLLALAACGEGSAFDESFKTTYREKFVATCVAGAEGQIPAGVTVDLDKICTCAADKVMEGKSATDLATTVPGSAEDLDKVKQCISELGPVKIGGAGG